MNTNNIEHSRLYGVYLSSALQSMSASSAASVQSAPPQNKDSVSIEGGSGENNDIRKWTVLFYGAGDNDLAPAIFQEVNQLESVGSGSSLNIVAQLDLPDDEKGCCKTYFIGKDADSQEITSPVLRNLGSVNMADPETLAGFIAYGIKKYPAEHYMLVIADHGKAWRGAISDMSHNGWMTTPDIRKSIEKGMAGEGKPLDVIAFDACLMASAEVAYELKDVAQYMVASEETEGAAGWSFPLILEGRPDENASGPIDSSLLSPLSPDISAADLASRIVDCAKANPGRLYTMSAINLSKMNDIGTSVKNFAQQIVNTDTPGDVFRGIVRKTQGVGERSLRDISHFAQLVSESPQISDVKLKETANEVTGSIDRAIMNKAGSNHAGNHENAHGLSIELPIVNVSKEGYEELAFAAKTEWQNTFRKILGR
ncbi:MAG: clostripain-related cysteine peptidase [Vulcanimicrobiota bacterium]